MACLAMSNPFVFSVYKMPGPLLMASYNGLLSLLLRVVRFVLLFQHGHFMFTCCPCFYVKENVGVQGFVLKVNGLKVFSCVMACIIPH